MALRVVALLLLLLLRLAWPAGINGGMAGGGRRGRGAGAWDGRRRGELARCLSSLLDLVLWRSSSLVWLWVSSIEGEAELEATHPVHLQHKGKGRLTRGEHKEEKEKEKAPAPVPGTASTAQGLQVSNRERRGDSTQRGGGCEGQKQGHDPPGGTHLRTASGPLLGESPAPPA